MTRQVAFVGVERPPLRGICLVVRGKPTNRDSVRSPRLVHDQQPRLAATVTEFPRAGRVPAR